MVKTQTTVLKSASGVRHVKKLTEIHGSAHYCKSVCVCVSTAMSAKSSSLSFRSVAGTSLSVSVGSSLSIHSEDIARLSLTMHGGAAASSSLVRRDGHFHLELDADKRLVFRFGYTSIPLFGSCPILSVKPIY